MLLNQYQELDEISKRLYFEVAVNPILKNILSQEKESIEFQILNLNKTSEETNEDFVLKHTRLTERRQILSELLQINLDNIKLNQKQE